MAQNNKIIDIIGVQSDYGASLRGADLAPKALRIAGIIEEIGALGYEVCDCNDISIGLGYQTNKATSHSKNNLNNLSEVNEINAKLYKQMCETLSRSHFPVVLGGDHSLAAGSVTAIQKHYKNIGLIWVDAHGDFNSEKSSPSGNIHGMPLSALTGNGPDEILQFRESGTSYINPHSTVLIAARALDSDEKTRLKNAGVTVFSMTDIDRLGIDEIMKQAVKIASSGTSGIYLSFDIDSVDPLVASGVGTPSSGGLSYREAHYLCEYLAANANLLGCEFVELNPIIDSNNQSAEFTVGLITSLLGKTII